MERIIKGISTNNKLLLYIFIVFISSRALLYLVGFLGINLFSNYETKPIYVITEQAPGWSKENIKLPENLSNTRIPKIKDLSKFDSGFYLNISKNNYDGYKIDQPHPTANWVFFPLYSVIISFVHFIMPFFSFDFIAVVISNVCFFIALILLFKICIYKGFTEFQSKLVVYFVTIFPTSLYFSVPYTESLFLLLSCLSIYLTYKQRYFLAFLAAGLSTITRVPGFINLLFVLGNIAINKNFKFNLKDIKYILYLLTSALPLTIFLAYMKYLTGDFLAPFHEQSINWFRKTTTPFVNLLNYIKHPYFIAPGGWDNGVISFIISISVLLIYILYLIYSLISKSLNKEEMVFYVYGMMLIIIPFSSSEIYLTSVVRYMMVSIPMYVYLVFLISKFNFLNNIYKTLFLSINTLITIAFFNNYYFVV